jgi:hypothetical protein
MGAATGGCTAAHRLVTLLIERFRERSAMTSCLIGDMRP